MAEFTEDHARRLLWRGGFGPRPGEAETLAKLGRDGAVDALVHAVGHATLQGPAPTDAGAPLDPHNVPGHDVLWWLDRMVRSTAPLEEKLTLFWHDHFATSMQDTPSMLRQNQLFRRRAAGRFRLLLSEVTTDPAMQQFLNLLGSDKRAPNENYARELMQLFSIGVTRLNMDGTPVLDGAGAPLPSYTPADVHDVARALMELFTLGTGYTESDVREAARALTGYRAAGQVGRVLTGVVLDPTHHDPGLKTIFGQTGAFGPGDVLDLVCAHPAHAPFLVSKLWDAFVPTAIDAATRARLVGIYAKGKGRIAPVVREVLRHDALYVKLDGPEMVKSPCVLLAGMLRGTGAPVDRRSYVSALQSMGQRPFAPPSVAGWDQGPAWMSSGSMRTRFVTVNELLKPGSVLAVADGSTPVGLSPDDATARAQAACGNPWASAATLAELRALATSIPLTGNTATRQRAADAGQRSLRHLLLSGPDHQVH